MVPLIPAVLISIGAVTGGGGVVLVLKGGYDIRKANVRIRSAGARYDEERWRLDSKEVLTNAALQTLGARQAQASQDVIDRMIDFLRQHKKQVSESVKLLVDGLDVAPGAVVAGEGLEHDAVAWMRGIVASAVTGVGVNVGVTGAVTTLASASTGAAISGLSGAAATNATLAFLGGGSLATGGGGMALGVAALNFVTVGPAVLVSGLVVAGQGEKAKTQARANEAAVNQAIAEAQAMMATFEAIVTRAHEIGSVLDGLVERSVEALDLLESEPFDPDRHATRFQQALTLTFAVRDVASAQVINEAGDLNEQSASYRVKYRTLMKEIGNA